MTLVRRRAMRLDTALASLNLKSPASNLWQLRLLGGKSHAPINNLTPIIDRLLALLGRILSHALYISVLVTRDGSSGYITR